MVQGLPHTTRKARTTRTRTLRSRYKPPTDLAAALAPLYDGISAFKVQFTGLENYKTTYGEVTPEGTQVLSQLFEANSSLTRFLPARRVFYDLGCGGGKVVLGMALLHPELRCTGFEIVPERVQVAQTALARIKQRSVANRISFTTTSFLDPKINLSNAGWIYISNLCFDTETQKALARKLEEECEPGTVVICSKEMPWGGESSWQLVAANQRIPMSWSTTASSNIYRRML